MMLDARAVASGSLRKSITFQTHSTSRDTFGQEQNMWTTTITTRGSIVQASAKELYSLGGHYNEQVTHIITVRFRTAAPIVAGMRARCDGKTYLVQAVNNIEQRNITLKLLCLEQQDQVTP